MSKAHELTEGQLATLGTALVHLDLVDHRIDVAVKRSTAGSVLEPARDDLAQAAELIRKVQRQLASTIYPSAAACETDKCSSVKTHKVHRNPIVSGLGRDGRRKSLGRGE